jgi:hypothetical protein
MPKKQTTVIIILDKIHPDLPKLSNDYNIYTLGSISKYNIVIACLPKGKIGIILVVTIAT